jgi:hypothetical protein
MSDSVYILTVTQQVPPKEQELYADDTVIFSESLEDMQKALDTFQ